jgi:hypothetical protein
VTRKDIALNMSHATEVASASDRQWFREHPKITQYLRPPIPGEFDAIALGRGDAPSFVELNPLPHPAAGFKWMVLVSIMNQDRTLRCREPFLISDKADDAPIPAPINVLTPKIEHTARLLKKSDRAEWLRHIPEAAP